MKKKSKVNPAVEFLTSREKEAERKWLTNSNLAPIEVNNVQFFKNPFGKEDAGRKVVELSTQNIHQWDGKRFNLAIEEMKTKAKVNPDKRIFSTGSTRKEIKEATHLVCPELERRVSLICAEGLKSYPWEEMGDADLTTAAKGMPLANLIRHANAHWLSYRRGDVSEDNLGKVAWAIQQIMHQEANGFHGTRDFASDRCGHYQILTAHEEDEVK